MLSVVCVLCYFTHITRDFSKCFQSYENYGRHHCFRCLREITVSHTPFFVSIHSLKMVFQKELDCMQEYWWVQSDSGNLT